MGSIFSMISSGSVTSVPPQPAPGLGDLEVAAGRRSPPAHAHARGPHVEEAAGLVLGQDARDVVVDHDNLVRMAIPLLGEHADGGGAAADPHALLTLVIDDGGAARLDHHLGATLHPDFHRPAAAEVEHGLAGYIALALGAAGQVAHAAQGQHLGAVLGRGDVADLLALAHDGRLLGAEIAVGVDLHLEAAVAEDALRDHGDHIHALGLAGDDEGGGLVIGIGGARADAGHEALGRLDDLAVPALAAFEEGHDALGALRHHQGIDARQYPIRVGIAVAGTDLARADAAQDRAGVAADGLGLGFSHRQPPKYPQS